MARTDQLGAPASTVYVDGENTLHRYWLHNATVAAPTAPVNVTGVQEVTTTAVAYDKSVEVFQQGGGEKLMLKYNPKHNVDVKMFARDVPAFLAAITGVTMGSAGYYALPLTWDDVPLLSWEMVYRQPDNATVVGSVFFQDLILKEFNFPSANENNVVTIPFYTRHIPLYLNNTCQPVFDQFNGDGSTTAFTLSGTPVAVMDVSEGFENKSDFVLDYCINCKVKLSTQDAGTRQKSGITITPAGPTLTFTTAPAAGSQVEIFWLVAV